MVFKGAAFLPHLRSYGNSMWNFLQPSYFIPQRSIHHRHLVIFFMFLVVIFQIILISGCTSSSAAGPSLYLVEFQYDAFNAPKTSGTGIVNSTAYDAFNSEAQKTSLIVHLGYFGVCTKSSKNADWKCGNNVNDQVKGLKPEQDPFNLVYTAFELKSGSTSPWVMIIGTCLTFFTCVALLMSRSAQTLTLPLATTLNVGAFIFLLIGMVWQQCSSGSMATAITQITGQAVKSKSGVQVAGLGWTSCIFVAMCAAGMAVILITEKRIEAETGEHHGVAKPHMSHHGGIAPMIGRHASSGSHYAHTRPLSTHSIPPMMREGMEPEYQMPSPPPEGPYYH